MDIRVINGLRNLALDMIDEAGSGHPGIALDAAPMMYTLFANHLVFNNKNGSWINRDRFVLSAGHASSLLYSTLFYSGYNIPFEELKKYRKINGMLPGYPVLNRNIGIEMTTGLLGEGFASAVGMAIAEEYLRSYLTKDIINYYTYVLVSDADLMEGIFCEAASLAGSLHLGHLIVLYDSNKVTSDGNIQNIFEENVLKRFEAMGWDTELVNNGEDYLSIDKAIARAKSVDDKPSIIQVNTILGIGSSFEGTNKVYENPLERDDLLSIKRKMNLTEVPFHVSKDAFEYIRNKQDSRNNSIYNEWLNKYNNLIARDPKRKKFIEELESGKLNINLKELNINFDEGMKEDLRITNQNLMKVISSLTNTFIGGCADVSNSTKAYINDVKDFSINERFGKNIHFGVRENAMGAIMNGLALSGLRPFGSTFLAFSNYMMPSIRLSAMMNLPVTYIFTHDSFMIGEDGVTYEPIEQLGTLRLIPNLNVIRPADVRELVSSWNFILNTNSPCALILPKSEKGMFKTSSIDALDNGGYIIKKENGRLSGIILATGSEVEDAIKISDRLDGKGIFTRVISVPCLEVFAKRTQEYNQSLFEVGAKIIVLEASNDAKWNEYVYNKRYIINVNSFGKSGSSEELRRYFKFDLDSLEQKIESLLK